MNSLHGSSRNGKFGVLLRHWRNVRRVSQLNLSPDAEISMRHLSCVETGRAQPSREMVLRLAEALEVPLRERNALLLAAGYAPLHSQTDLDAPELEAVHHAVDFLVAQLEPLDCACEGISARKILPQSSKSNRIWGKQ